MAIISFTQARQKNYNTYMENHKKKRQELHNQAFSITKMSYSTINLTIMFIIQRDIHLGRKNPVAVTF
jgi:hypothetical protein